MSRVNLQRLLMGVLALALPASVAAQPAPVPRAIPVYDLDDRVHTLQVTVHEAVYGSEARFPVAQLPPELATRGTGDPERSVLGYLDAVLRDQPELARSFYPPGEDSDRIQTSYQIYRSALAGTTTVRLDRVWYFGRFRVFHVEPISPGGERPVVTVSVEWTGDRYVRTDHWGDLLQPVQELFWYMVLNINRSRVEGRGPRSFELSIRIEDPQAPEGAAGRSIELAFDGIRYPSVETWTPIKPEGGDLQSPGEFAHRALAIAESGSDQQFLSLWTGKRREWLERTQAESPPFFIGARRELGGVQAVRDVLTITLGDELVHYFLDRRAPGDLRALVLEREGGRLWLSQDLYASVRELLTSKLFRDELKELFPGVGR